MKIEDRLSNYMALLKEAYPPTSTQTVKNSRPQTSGAGSSVTVQVSVTAAQLAEDETRRKRLETIRQQLADGSYNISGKDVADKMLKVLKG
ncbi:MAG TPA: flagellar biosynthesis anti-sigma factor FlgM [Desulfuromonadales bacterium]|nr:flagellar biosynthesis anti-sigma factor FlgM [Desulfuromonadales bacterium]